MDKITKLLSVKSADQSNGEHTLTVIATDSSTDRDGERYDTASLLLPLKDGTSVRADQLKGDEDLDIQAFVNHDRDVSKSLIGSVSSAQLTDAGLQLVIRLSQVEEAQRVYTLASEKHLGNNISVTFDMSDADMIEDKFVGASVLEVSVVWRGSNKNARVLAVKERKDMEKKKTPEEVAEALGQAKDALAQANDAVTAALAANSGEEAGDEESGEHQENEVPAEKAAEGETTPPETVVEEKEEETVEKSVQKSIAAKQAKESAGTTAKAVTTSNTSNYLDSMEAVKDYFQNIAEHRSNVAVAVKSWSQKLEEKGITGDAFLPSEISQIFITNFEKPTGILGTVKQLAVKTFVVNALTGTGDTARAAGHKKGDAKREQALVNKRRQLFAKMLYKKLSLDAIDLWNTPELALQRTAELATQLVNEIERAIVIGDGRSAPSGGAADYRVFVDGEGIFSIKADAAAAGGTFGALVASTYTPTEADTNLYDKILGAVSLIKAEGQRVLVVKASAIADMYRAKANGNYLIQPGADLANVFGVSKVFTPSWMDEDEDNDAYIYTDGGYTLIGDKTPTQRTDFDTTYNKDVLLLEVPKAGSLSAYKAAVAIAVVEGA